jgi:5-formyltetrahydrofolate cyclo-ligase
MDDLLSQKKAIRNRILITRDSLSMAEWAEKSEAICSAIKSIKEYSAAQSILFFMPFRGEVDIKPLIEKALQQGRRCALPKCGKGGSLKLFSISNLSADVEPGMFGITEPKECMCEYTCDKFSVIIIPGVAFDRQGRRIGYGAGYYDRLLAKAARGSLIIAPAFALQVLAELPHGGHDVPVDIIVTEEETIDCRKAGGEYHG